MTPFASSLVRGSSGFLAGAFALLAVAADAAAQVRLLDSPNVKLTRSAQVNAVVRQPDGKWLIAGEDLSIVNELPRAGIARLNADGTLDAGFALDQPFIGVAERRMLAVALAPDGRIYVGGNFFLQVAPGDTRRNLIRLAPDGTMDLAWNPDPNGTVHAILPDVGGNTITVGGTFTSIAGAPRDSLARLSGATPVAQVADFAAVVNGSVFALRRIGAELVVGGSFSRVNTVPRGGIAKVDAATGVLDASWNPGVFATVRAIADSADGSIIVGGSFSQFGSPPAPRANIAKVGLGGAGAVDAAFNPGASGGSGLTPGVHALVVTSSGRIAVAGDFTTLGGAARGQVGMLLASGALDTGFDAGVASNLYGSAPRVRGLADSAEGLLIGGRFDTVKGARAFSLARVDAAGVPDAIAKAAFVAEVQNFPIVRDIEFDPSNGDLIAGGEFEVVADQFRHENLVRLRRMPDAPNGEPQWAYDPAFSIGAFGDTSSQLERVNAIEIVAGVAYVAGLFDTLGGSPRVNLGGIDLATGMVTPWIVNTDNGGLFRGMVLDLESSGTMLYVSGYHATIGGQSRPGIARIDTAGTGSVDLSFDAQTTGAFTTLQPESGGTVLTGGLFSQLNGMPRSNVGRTPPIPAQLGLALDGPVDLIARFTGSSRVTLGGRFTMADGTAANGALVLDTTGSGTVVSRLVGSAIGQAPTVVATGGKCGLASRLPPAGVGMDLVWFHPGQATNNWDTDTRVVVGVDDAVLFGARRVPPLPAPSPQTGSKGLALAFDLIKMLNGGDGDMRPVRITDTIDIAADAKRADATTTPRYGLVAIAIARNIHDDGFEERPLVDVCMRTR